MRIIGLDRISESGTAKSLLPNFFSTYYNNNLIKLLNLLTDKK
jgi:hypothetical protein